MDLGLKGKVAIVGGASIGIGYGIARALALEDARIVMTEHGPRGHSAHDRAKAGRRHSQHHGDRGHPTHRRFRPVGRHVGAIIGYAKTLSLEVAKHDMNVNTICPGYIETTRLEKVFAADGRDPRAMRAKLEAEIPMRRIGSVDDIAAMVALLVSPRGRYTTGAAIAVDGGLFRGVR